MNDTDTPETAKPRWSPQARIGFGMMIGGWLLLMIFLGLVAGMAAPVIATLIVLGIVSLIAGIVNFVSAYDNNAHREKYRRW